MIFLYVCDRISKIYTVVRTDLKNVVVKTALKVILAVIIAMGVAFATASLGFPKSMATLFENMGAYSFATGYASLAYKYSGTVENLARCVDDSVFGEDEPNIVNFGNKLVKHSDFLNYSQKRTDESGIDYFHFVYSNLAVAKYGQGDKKGALETAKTSMQDVSDFPVNNALAALAIRAAEKSDEQFSQQLLQEISAKVPSAEQQNYYDAVKNILSNNS